MGILGRVIGGLLGGPGGYIIGKKADENPQVVKKGVKHYVKAVKNNPVGAGLGSIFGPVGIYLGAKYIKF